jgi:hypothetical protein
VFPFFKLPTELRHEILILALVNENGIKLWFVDADMVADLDKDNHHENNLKPCSFLPVCSVLTPRSFAMPSHTNTSQIFLVNKQLHYEAKRIAYGCNKFLFSDTMMLTDFIKYALNNRLVQILRLMLNYRYIKKLELTLDTVNNALNRLMLYSLFCPEEYTGLKDLTRPSLTLIRSIFLLLRGLSHIQVHAKLWIPTNKYLIAAGCSIFLSGGMLHDFGHVIKLDFRIPSPFPKRSSNEPHLTSKPILSKVLRRLLVPGLLADGFRLRMDDVLQNIRARKRRSEAAGMLST